MRGQDSFSCGTGVWQMTVNEPLHTKGGHMGQDPHLRGSFKATETAAEKLSSLKILIEMYINLKRSGDVK